MPTRTTRLIGGPARRPGGSPGADDPAAGALRRFSSTRFSPPAYRLRPDAVELFNPTAGDVDLGGWFLTDDPGQPMKYRIPADTIH